MSLSSLISNFFSSPASSNSSSAQAVSHVDVGHGISPGVADTPDFGTGQRGHTLTDLDIDDAYVETEGRPPYLHSIIAGGLGGTTGDLLMHSLDTVKTRQQGDTHIPPKYTSMSASYLKILRQEGFVRGLYSGVTPAFLGSFPGTLIFFGTYECSKRHMIDFGVIPSVAYLTGGFLADLAASTVYVPSEVLKTRLQLQGRYNNPFFHSGYNYRSTLDAARTIVRQEGFSALFYGYRATLFRDLPFSALQFAFYEQEQKWAKEWVGSKSIGLPLEILTGASAGGLAGVITCPLDVVKTRIQTQINPAGSEQSSAQQAHSKLSLQEAAKRSGRLHAPSSRRHQMRLISTSSPSTSTPRPGSETLDTSSVLTGLARIYKTEGIAGWFRGVGPRFVWTSVQSGTMLVLYQELLRQLEAHPLFNTGSNEGSAIA
ncbi:putative mitochondrial carrier protein [Xylona heveae TC161]|uniref:Putative mitochondrial carrier protein n=1 Tax=Xylona heveae (strain CBS 132557 / TC161) TaxID=1328760 RepID=A0A165HD90_XYLHT|nr:putative mitochondrial carrier protein [Xylona heveae TC161]KZF23332.1 putative mitochondrial carrier protein [Xylona heveae TC161]